MKLDVINIEGKSTGRSVDLSDQVFGIEPNNHAIYLAVKQFNANQRQGNSKTKERGEITGSMRKIKRQKGTGTARMGSIKNPLLRGGGRIFGPRPRSYSFKLNKKVKRLARLSALSTKANKGDLVVVEDFTFDQPQTTEYLKILEQLEVLDKKSLIVTSDYDNNIYLSSRNVDQSQVMNAKDLNTYRILDAQKIILSESAVETMNDTFGIK